MIESIDYAKCTGCRICVDLCPMGVLRLNTSTQEIPPCQAACPAGADMRDYIYRVTQGDLKGALSSLMEALPLLAITGRVCSYPCEPKCARKEVDEAVNINALERFVGDCFLKEKAKPVPRRHVGKVAVIGAGPAGLSAAYYLVRMGYPVTIYEAMREPGGMLRYGIPEYRLPRNVVNAHIEYIKDMGVEFRTGVTVGKDITIGELKDDGYKAFFVAVGANKSLELNIPGKDLKGVHYGLDFLRDFNMGKKVEVGKRVVVVGGGDASTDAARTALRLGAEEVSIIYRRSRKEMPARAEEMEMAENEGVKIIYLAAPNKFLGENGKVSGMEFVRMELGAPDASGRRSPVPVKGSEFLLGADMVIPAIGEILDTACWSELDITSERTLSADPVSFATSTPGIFAGGDAVTGPSSVVEAIASGKRAALSIDRYVKGEGIKKRSEPQGKVVEALPKEGIRKRARQSAAVVPFRKGSGDFHERKSGLGRAAAMDEAQRCMTCGSKAYIAYLESCMTCYSCEMECPSQAVNVDPFRKVMPVLIRVPGDETDYDVLYTAQALGGGR